LNNYNNEIKLNSKRLLDIILDAKNKDSDSILFLINKYKPLIIKYSISYILKNYDKEDLIQIGTIAVIKAIEKYDISHGEDFIDCYIINSIKNTYRNLARANIKYQSESSLNISVDEDIDIQSLLPDDYNLENDIIKTMQHVDLKNLLKSLTLEEYTLIKEAYLTENSNLYKYCITNNLNYHKKRRKLIALLSKLKIKLSK
jgi:RNA polymerase sporulation-specific sigma factor